MNVDDIFGERRPRPVITDPVTLTDVEVAERRGFVLGRYERLVEQAAQQPRPTTTSTTTKWRPCGQNGCARIAFANRAQCSRGHRQ